MKKITKIVCAVFIMLLTCQNASASTALWINYSGGTYYICPGVAYAIGVTNLPSGWFVNSSSTKWGWCTQSGDPNCTSTSYTVPSTFFVNEGHDLTVNNGGVGLTLLVTDAGGTDHAEYIVFTTAIVTSITGVSDICVGSQYTYTATTNAPNVSSWSWTDPSFVSGTSTTSSITLTDNAGGGPSALTAVANGTGCPTNLITATKNLTSHSSIPAAPSGTLSYHQYNNSCLFYASISAVSGATSYEWSIDNFAHILKTTTSPNSSPGDFDYSTNYNIYVKAGNCVGYSASTHWNKTTPAKPGGCTERMRDPSLLDQTGDYKVYPNPTSTNLTIEYPTMDFTDHKVAVYDLLGHQVSLWVLPNAENQVTENTSELPNGIYMYVISSSYGIMTRGKLMIQH